MTWGNCSWGGGWELNQLVECFTSTQENLGSVQATSDQSSNHEVDTGASEAEGHLLPSVPGNSVSKDGEGIALSRVKVL